jgi:pyruvate/2-oxoglutarate dehydrogenase complex dihydrolipoamide dehydrogenase (E3) component
VTTATCDAVVMGGGPAGEVAVSRLHDQGLMVALVERELVGGECAYWACIPSKTLLRPPEARSDAERTAGVATPDIAWAEVAKYRDFMTRHLDDTDQVEGHRKQGVDPRVHGIGRSVSLRDTVTQFPTFTEAYLLGVERLES